MASDAAPITLYGYPVRERTVRVGPHVYPLVGPANYESLIDTPQVIERFKADEYLPYWAEFWPACLILADRIARWPAVAAGAAQPCVLELGCGLGLLSVVAAKRGYRCIASDYDADALRFAQVNARRNGVAIETRLIDWRERYDDLRPDWIVAAEVTYERRHLAPLAAFLSHHLPPGGRALLVDRDRQVADAFVSAVEAAGLRGACTPADCAEESGLIEGRLFEVSRPENER